MQKNTKQTCFEKSQSFKALKIAVLHKVSVTRGKGARNLIDYDIYIFFLGPIDYY